MSTKVLPSKTEAPQQPPPDQKQCRKKAAENTEELWTCKRAMAAARTPESSRDAHRGHPKLPLLNQGNPKLLPRTDVLAENPQEGVRGASQEAITASSDALSWQTLVLSQRSCPAALVLTPRSKFYL